MSIVTFSVETIPNLKPQTKTLLNIVEVITVIVFTFIILMIGLGIVAIPTGIISSALTKSIDEKETE